MTPELRRAVERRLAGAGGQRRNAAAMTARYKDGGASRGLGLAAYLAARLPATFAAVARVLAELRARRPGLAPRSLLDVGAGPGTASWAALDAWPGLSTITMLDNDAEFLKLAEALWAEGAGNPQAKFVRGRMDAALPEAQLVIAAYGLAEIPPAGQAEAVASLWRAAKDTLVLVEPGTPAGFERLRAARTLLIASGAVVVAPCTHAHRCPMADGDWCHFAVRLARSRAHLHAKNASVPFEDEKFSCLIVSRDGAPSGGARVLAPPMVNKVAATLKLCGAAGLERRVVASRDRATYSRVKKLGWGDLMVD